MTALVEVAGLRVGFADGAQALRGLDVTLDRGESLAVVGESGAGKSTLAHCLAGLVQPPQATGSVRVDGCELLDADEDTLRRLRWATVAVGLQQAAFNPVATVGAQLAEPYTVHLGLGAGEARRRADDAAADLGLDPGLLDRYPHQLSGGQRRWALVAMTLALDPPLVVLDEPTSGLDPRTKRDLADRLRTLAGERGFALMAMTHDLSDAARLADRCMVLYAGEAMEAGETTTVLGEPAHPYSAALVGAYPVMTTTKDLRPIRGRAPDPRQLPSGCPFAPRCTQAEDVCRDEPVELAASRGRQVACHFGGLKTLLTATGVAKTFTIGKQPVAALRGVSLEVGEGEAVGIIGASGSGKTTLARILAGHLDADAGDVTLQGEAMSTSWRASARRLRRRIQLVAQDPWDALSPRLSVAELVGEPLEVTGERDRADQRVAAVLDAVGLPSTGAFLACHTGELSGGQLQRVALARALILEPKVVVADEPTAMLDASEQARLLVLLRELQVERGLALVLVSHDLAVVRKVTDRVVVLDAGTVAETGPSHRVSTRPASAATHALIDAAPALDLGGEPHADPGEGSAGGPASVDGGEATPTAQIGGAVHSVSATDGGHTSPRSWP